MAMLGITMVVLSLAVVVNIRGTSLKQRDLEYQLKEETLAKQVALEEQRAEELEEARRLCYVAITRAKRRLTITCAHQRMLYGRTTVSRPSRFLAEIPEELVERKQHTQPRFVQQAKPRPRPTMPHSDTLGSHHASGPVIDFRKGDTVEHDVFGRGLVLSVLPTGNDKMLEIAFDQIGTKRLMANFAASRMRKL